MDVVLSIVAGLGLRIFLIGPSDKLTAALIGLWEGIVVHQLSARSRSPPLDHALAYILRLFADLLISKNPLRLFMILLWTPFGTLVSEAFLPYASLRSALRRQREREKERERERRHRYSRSGPEALPIPSTPPPLPMRTHSEPYPQRSSTPLISSIPPLTPPSFFLHGTSDIGSPSPKPVHLQLQSLDSPIQDSLPVRPRSGLASTLERSPVPGSILNLFPTPPESAAPSDGPDVQNGSADVHDTTKTMSRLSPIAELSSPDTTPSETVDQQNKAEFEQNQQLTTFSPFEAISLVPPPVINTAAYSSHPPVGAERVLASHSANQNSDEIFNTPFSPAMSPAAPIPVPIPQRHRQDLHATPRNSCDTNISQIVDVVRDPDDDSDELQTPGLQDTLNAETDNENDDPLMTPVGMKSGENVEPERDQQLSPLGLDVNSGLSSDDYIHGEGSFSDPAPDAPVNDEEELLMPGSLSQNLLLQPPLPPSGSFLRPPASPVPPSPSTIFSDTSMLSQLSTRVPKKLFIRADEYRKQARQEEQSREQLDMQRKAAEAQGKMAEALMLKIRIRELDEKAFKLHEKAARRYYAGKSYVISLYSTY